MVLGNNLNGEMILQYFNVWIGAYGSHQSALNLCSGVISMMEDAKFRVTTFAV